MKHIDDPLQAILVSLPVRTLPPSLAQRTLARARIYAEPAASERSPVDWPARVLCAATPAALVSADLVFAADACTKIARALGS